MNVHINGNLLKVLEDEYHEAFRQLNHPQEPEGSIFDWILMPVLLFLAFSLVGMLFGLVNSFRKDENRPFPVQGRQRSHELGV